MSLPATTKVLCITTLLLCGWSGGFAAEAPPASEASIRELIAVTRVEELMKGVSAQTDSMIQAAMAQAMQGKQVSAEHRQILDEMRTKMRGLMDEVMSWKEIQALTIDIYKRSFTQPEVEGMLAFYKTEAGKAVINKMPLITQNTMQAMQGRMAILMPKIQQLQEETLAKLKASK